MKVTFTLEDLPDGGLLMQSDPAIDALLDAARCRPSTLTPAEAMGAVVWDALLHAARRMAKGRRVDGMVDRLRQPHMKAH